MSRINILTLLYFDARPVSVQARPPSGCRMRIHPDVREVWINIYLWFQKNKKRLDSEKTKKIRLVCEIFVFFISDVFEKSLSEEFIVKFINVWTVKIK